METGARDILALIMDEHNSHLRESAPSVPLRSGRARSHCSKQLLCTATQKRSIFYNCAKYAGEPYQAECIDKASADHEPADSASNICIQLPGYGHDLRKSQGFLFAAAC